MNPTLIIPFKKLYPDAKAPVRAHETDAGWDLFLHEVTKIEGKPNGYRFHTGIAVDIPRGYFGLLRPRSSISKTTCAMNSSGVIDAGYRGELIMPIISTGEGTKYDIGDKVCQLIILPLPKVDFLEVQELSSSERGEGGFGSTGTR